MNSKEIVYFAFLAEFLAEEKIDTIKMVLVKF